MKEDVVARLKEFLEQEARSCSMDSISVNDSVLMIQG